MAEQIVAVVGVITDNNRFVSPTTMALLPLLVLSPTTIAMYHRQHGP
jgi:hypothetical protein